MAENLDPSSCIRIFESGNPCRTPHPWFLPIGGFRTDLGIRPSRPRKASGKTGTDRRWSRSGTRAVRLWCAKVDGDWVIAAEWLGSPCRSLWRVVRKSDSSSGCLEWVPPSSGRTGKHKQYRFKWDTNHRKWRIIRSDWWRWRFSTKDINKSSQLCLMLKNIKNKILLLRLGLRGE